VRWGELVALMRGVSPADGSVIRTVGGDGSRVAGIDLTFSAPKSVSALWAVSGSYRRAQIMAAHRSAVASAMERLERDVALVRRREHGVLRSEAARSLVAGEFVHTASRLTRDQERGGVPDPQLHSHVLVVAAERQDGRFAAVDSREIYRSARANGAFYRAELAWALGELGLEVHGHRGRDGRYFEVAGVPEALSSRWSARSADIDAAARTFRARYGREPRGGELGALTVATRGTKTLTGEANVDQAWHAVGEEYGLGAREAEGLFSARALHEQRPMQREVLAGAVADRAMVSDRDLRAHAYELAAGVERPERTWQRVSELARSGELIRLEGDVWTTRQLRELEQRTIESVRERAHEQLAPVSLEELKRAERAAGAELGGSLSAEQRDALGILTGRGGVSVLVGQAGTGKGVVIAAAREAWEREGYRVLGSAVAGATAKRLGADAKISETMTVDALVHRQDAGQLGLDARTVVVLDEAGMADTRRLAAITETTARSQSKLVLVGDSAQLSSIGAGGLFEQVRGEAPSAELSQVYRAQESWERSAWRQVRAGDAHRALSSYEGRGRLHVSDTRTEAGERMVSDWDRARREHPAGRVVMLTDASNAELDQLNAAAQQRRAQAGELGQRRVQIPERPYALAAGDQVMLTGQLQRPGCERVENGTQGEVLSVDEREQRVVMRTAEQSPRDVDFNTSEFSDVRLAYAQHLYKAQGATVDRALFLTGGWQTDRERAYVGLTRARERTDVYVSREDLGEQGLDTGAIQRLAERMEHSRAQQASVTREPAGPEETAQRPVAVHEPDTTGALSLRPGTVGALDGTEEVSQRTGAVREFTSEGERDVAHSRVGRILQEQQRQERERALSRDEGLGL